MKPEDVTISGNDVTENAQGGIVLRCKLSSLFNITENYVANNYGAGIYVGGPGNVLQNNVITGNKMPPTPRGDEAADNPNGIRVSREADDTVLKDNDLSGNEAADLFIKEDLVGCEMESNVYNSYEGLEEIKGKKVQTGNPEIPSGSSMSIAELIGIILSIVVLVIIGYGFTRRKKRVE
jgi:parallel beta-helix repeat protein